MLFNLFKRTKKIKNTAIEVQPSTMSEADYLESQCLRLGLNALEALKIECGNPIVETRENIDYSTWSDGNINLVMEASNGNGYIQMVNSANQVFACIWLNPDGKHTASTIIPDVPSLGYHLRCLQEYALKY